uniref:NAC domain-containing protein n=1 Tax=Leersia perrieri TaxID=77586 RepID=A0A0D9WGL2_9ORYZ
MSSSRDDADDGSFATIGEGRGSGEEEAAAGEAADGNAAAGDSHENDLVMPGFRFHPTEEELIEFYLRRKVEGRRFNVELITFLDLYRFDPWELPAMAVMGEKEWFFYVPRDRKYRNGDRPNRVTASGYWKATGADRMIRGENSRPIGLKKTLVFYSGKAPKGVRSSWIMNEYRLPPPAADADLFYKSEISLCRVYKRSGIDDQRLSTSNVQASTSSTGRQQRSSPSTSSTPLSSPPPPPTQQQQQQHPIFHHLLQGECSSPSSSSLPASAAATRNASHLMPPPPPRPPAVVAPIEISAAASTYSLLSMAHHVHVAAGSSSTSAIDELGTLIGHGYGNNHHTAAGGRQFIPLPPPPLPLPLPQLMPHQQGTLPVSPLEAAVSDKLWDWNSVPDDDTAARDYGSSGLSDPK